MQEEQKKLITEIMEADAKDGLYEAGYKIKPAETVTDNHGFNNMAQQKMTIEKWLSDVYYDEYGTHIWNREDADGGIQLVAEIIGWGRLQNEFPTIKESEKFQDEVGKFIVEAIREKIERLKTNQVPDIRKEVSAVEWYYDQTVVYGKTNYAELLEQAKQIEKEQRKEDIKMGYNQGYMDAQCNHINDADNFANEQLYKTNNHDTI